MPARSSPTHDERSRSPKRHQRDGQRSPSRGPYTSLPSYRHRQPGRSSRGAPIRKSPQSFVSSPRTQGQQQFPSERLTHSIPASFEQGPDGYRHLPQRLPPLIIDLPSWLTSSLCMHTSFLRSFLITVPPLPIVSDPMLFLAIFENNLEPDDRAPIRKNSTLEMRRLQYLGDSKLREICDPIFYRQTGRNYVFASSMSMEWQTNANFRFLSAAYQLHQYTGWHPEKLGDPGRDKEKFWADVWEAWWGAAWLERDLWSEGFEDLQSIQHHLIYLCRKRVFDTYSLDYIFDSSINHENKEVLEENPDIDIKEVMPSDSDVRMYLEGVQGTSTIGFLAKIPASKMTASQRTPCSVFAATQTEALVLAQRVINGTKCNLPFLPFHR